MGVAGPLMILAALALSATALSVPTLHGTQGSRSPLVNWFAAEANVQACFLSLSPFFPYVTPHSFYISPYHS